MPEVSIIGLGRIVVVQGEVAVPVGLREAIQFSKRHGLNNVVAFLGPVFQVHIGFVTVEAVKQLPCRITKVEKGCTITLYQITFIGTYLQRLASKRKEGACAA